jgi:cell division protein FtsL
MAEPRAEAPRSRGAHRPAWSRRRRSTVLVLLLCLAFVVLLFVFVYPTRTFVQQRRELDNAQQQLTVLDQGTKTLKSENDRLQSDAEVERRAREDYGLVQPGETPYVLVPAPSTTAPPQLP